jgi:DNA invertase Pin-like site-specific DNA recombinase
MLSFAQFEREMIIERTREGKAIAKESPGFKEGRPRKYSSEQVEFAVGLLKDHSYRKVARLTGISISSLERFKREYSD